MDNSFGETLRSLRSEKELSQQDLAEKLFVDRSSIASRETGASGFLLKPHPAYRMRLLLSLLSFSSFFHFFLTGIHSSHKRPLLPFS